MAAKAGDSLLMTEGPSRAEIIEAFGSWCQQPGYPHERMRDLERLASAAPSAWRDAMLTLVPDEPTEEDLGCLFFGFRAALASAPDRDAMEADLAARARGHRTLASVVAHVLSFGSKGVGELHAIDVLGEDLLFNTWSRLEANRLEGSLEGAEVTVDEWASDIMDGLIYWSPDAAWRLFLRYLEHENDAGLRDQAGIAWLETINFGHAAEFIDRIEIEARANPRLRAVMRFMFPPSGDHDLERRFRTAMEEPST